MIPGISLRHSCLAMFFLWSLAFADGYRPESSLEGAFIDGLADAEIAVFPTVVRDPYVAGFSSASRQLLIDYLAEHGLAAAHAADVQFDLGLPEHRPQYELFMESLGKIGNEVRQMTVQADYVMVLEVVFPPTMGGRIQVFGIHVFILTPTGENAFSFLLNSHHQVFNSARLYSSDTSPQGREELVMKSTRAALGALDAQIRQMRACGAPQGLAFPVTAGVGVVADFESGLPAATDRHGIAVGFSTFSGDRSRVWTSTTTDHPALPGEKPGNRVLKLDFDVNSWAGALHRFTDDANDRWVAFDWRGARELSFWLYGNDSGTTLVVDVLDNRQRCSNRDDAERYSYEFRDDFSGWKLFAIPFEVMTRKDIGNGAPDDGLELAAAHGWAFAALRTFGPQTFFIDDVRLRHVPVLDSTPVGEFRNRYVWCPTNELPMFGGFEKTAWQKQADEEFLARMIPHYGGDRAAGAERFAQMGWNLYYQGNKTSAIKRFNQAWLLDADNQQALWGFAAIARERGRFDDALRYYEMALESGPEQPKLRQEYEQLVPLQSRHPQ